MYIFLKKSTFQEDIMKRMFFVALAVLMVLSNVSVAVFAESDGLEYKLSEDGTYYIVSGYHGTDADVIIPSSYNDLPVKELGANLFNYCITIESIVIPDTVTVIEIGAFEDCINLETVVMSSNVTYIGVSAFRRCNKLTEIIIPDSIEAVDRLAFSGCDSLNYSEYDNALYLGNSDNPYLVLATASSKEITSCQIHQDTRIIAGNAFDSSNLESIVVPDTVTFIGGGAFMWCPQLTNVTLSDSITSIESNLFENCPSLETLILPDNIEAIKDSAFSRCNALNNVVIPDTVTEIASCAFMSCESLKSISIPASVEIIGESVFMNCDGLTDIYCEAESKPENWDELWYSNGSESAPTVHWGSGASDVLVGDVTMDGVVDMFDYLLVKSFYFDAVTLSEEEFRLADTNADGMVDMFDYLYIKSAYFAS